MGAVKGHKLIATWVTPELKEKCLALAQQRGISVSALLRDLVDEAAREHGIAADMPQLENEQ